MMRNIISLFFFLSIACRTEGAKTEEEPSEGTEAGESGSTDTDTDIEEEQEEEGDGVSPVITSAESEYTFVYSLQGGATCSMPLAEARPLPAL